MRERKTLKEVALETDGVEMENSPDWIVRSMTSQMYGELYEHDYSLLDNTPDDIDKSDREVVIDMFQNYNLRQMTKEEIYSEFQDVSRDKLNIGNLFQMLMGGEVDHEELREMSSSYNFAIAIQMYQTYYSMTMN